MKNCIFFLLIAALDVVCAAVEPSPWLRAIYAALCCGWGFVAALEFSKRRP